jgi:glucose/arabinose dehydrogenase
MVRPTSRVPARRGARLASLLVVLTLSLTGCASFPNIGQANWHDKPSDSGPLAAPPNVPPPGPDNNQPDQPQPNQLGQQAAPNGCDDPDPQVIATCLNPVSAIAVLPDGQSALVAERDTGRILVVQKGKDPQVFATVPVDSAGGGLMGLVLSPSYQDDQLIYAYAASGGDNRVLRISRGYPPVPILSGIPRTSGDAGAMTLGEDGALLVATGSSGPYPGPGSLAGKLLRIDTFGHPFKDNPNPSSPIYSSGLQSPAGLCTTPVTGTVWVTDRLADHDALYQIKPGKLGDPAWSWPDRPGVAGCVAPPGSIAVGERGGAALFLLRTSPAGGFTGTPQTLLPGTYGRLDPVVLGPDGLVWLGTTNKGAGGPVVSSDDRVIRIRPLAGGNGSGPD